MQAGDLLYFSVCVRTCARAFVSLPGPFGYNEEVEIRVDFSLPVTAAAAAMAEGTDDLAPTLSLVVGSTSTAKTTTYLTAAAVYATVADLLSGPNDTTTTSSSLSSSSLTGGNSSHSYNDTSAFFKYVVAADDESIDLR